MTSPAIAQSDEAPGQDPAPAAAQSAARKRLLKSERIAIAWTVSGLLVAGGVVQQFVEPGALAVAISTVAVAIAFVAIPYLVRGRLLDAVAGFRLATVVLSILAAASALGTMILQGRPAEFYQMNYGVFSNMANKAGLAGLAGAVHSVEVAALKFFRFDDLFHTVWFGAMLGLMMSGLIVSAIRRWPITRRNVGFFAVHTGLIVTLAGASLSGLFAVKGRIHLRVGEPPASTVTINKGGVPTGQQEALGGAVQLNQFDIDRYRDQLRITLYLPEKDGKGFRLKHSFEPTAGLEQRLPAGASFKIKAFVEDVGAQAAAAAPASPHMLQIGDEAARPVSLGETIKLGDGTEVKVARFFPHFTYDIEKKEATNLSDKPVNPALEIELGGENGGKRWLFANAPGHAHQKAGPQIIYAYVSPEAQQKTAAVTLVVKQPGDMPREHTLVAGREGGVRVGDGFLAFEARGSEEVKSFRSHVTVREGNTERQALIAVNEPLTLGDWVLYQANYSDSDPNYSGIDAVRDPGVSWVFAGFGLIFAGVVYMTYISPRLRRRREA